MHINRFYTDDIIYRQSNLNILDSEKFCQYSTYISMYLKLLLAFDTVIFLAIKKKQYRFFICWNNFNVIVCSSRYWIIHLQITLSLWMGWYKEWRYTLFRAKSFISAGNYSNPYNFICIHNVMQSVDWVMS